MFISDSLTGAMQVGTLIEIFGIRVIQFECISEPCVENVVQKCVQEAEKKAVNAFQILMAGGRHQPAKKQTTCITCFFPNSLLNKHKKYSF